MSDEVTTFTKNLAGRDIVFRHPIPAQLIMLRRKLLSLQDQAAISSEETEKVDLSIRLIAYTLDVVESLIVDPADVQFLETAMMQGKVDHVEVMEVLAVKEPERPKVTRKRAVAKTVPHRARPKR